MEKRLPRNLKVTRAILDQQALEAKKQRINNIKAYLAFALVVFLLGIFCVWWGFGGLNNRFLARFSENTRTITAWIALTITVIGFLLAGYLYSTLKSTRRNFAKMVVEYDTLYPDNKYAENDFNKPQKTVK